MILALWSSWMNAYKGEKGCLHHPEPFKTEGHVWYTACMLTQFSYRHYKFILHCSLQMDISVNSFKGVVVEYYYGLRFPLKIIYPEGHRLHTSTCLETMHVIPPKNNSYTLNYSLIHVAHCYSCYHILICTTTLYWIVFLLLCSFTFLNSS